MVNRWKARLQNPVALALQGFALGALLFFTVHPLSGSEPASSPVTGESVLSTLQV